MSRCNETMTAPLQLRKKSEALQQTYAEENIPRNHGSDFLKNLALASTLVLCAVALRTGRIPPLDTAADVVLTAATDQTLLDEQLGKLSFVSSLFPETVLVFGESPSAYLSEPVASEDIIHVWSEQEPYVVWSADEDSVSAAADGEVTGIYHGNGDEIIVKIMSEDGLSCVYGNLKETTVMAGDHVSAGEIIGYLSPDGNLAFEVMRYGVSIDPTPHFGR